MEIHRYTKEEQEFMRRYVPGHSHREIQQAFCEQFGWNISINQVKDGQGGLKRGMFLQIKGKKVFVLKAAKRPGLRRGISR